MIIVLLVVLAPHFHGEDRIYAYAIGDPRRDLRAAGDWRSRALGRIDFRLQFHVDWRDPRIKQVFMLMLPVTIGLGIVNLDQLINSAFGSLVSEEAPRAIDNAFRDLHAAPGPVQRGRRDRAVPDAQPPGLAARRAGGCAARSATGCARSTCC